MGPVDVEAGRSRCTRLPPRLTPGPDPAGAPRRAPLILDVACLTPRPVGCDLQSPGGHVSPIPPLGVAPARRLVCRRAEEPSSPAAAPARSMAAGETAPSAPPRVSPPRRRRSAASRWQKTAACPGRCRGRAPSGGGTGPVASRRPWRPASRRGRGVAVGTLSGRPDAISSAGAGCMQSTGSGNGSPPPAETARCGPWGAERTARERAAGLHVIS